jgi:putative transposase
VIHPVTINAPKLDELDYVKFAIAAQRVFTCTEAAACQLQEPEPPAHNAFTRLLSPQPPDTAALWQEVKTLVRRRAGALLLDDSTFDKPYTRQMDFGHPPLEGQAPPRRARDQFHQPGLD